MKGVQLKTGATTKVLNTINSLLIRSSNARPLEGKEIDIFHIIWEDKNITYQEIAENTGMSKGGAVKVLARICKLLKCGLSLEEVRLTKGNLRVIVEPIINKQYPIAASDEEHFQNNSPTPLMPESTMLNNNKDRLDSFNRQFYITRIEEDIAARLLSQPGTLLRIIGQKKFGKTLFIKSVLDKMSISANTVEIDIELAGSKNLSDPDAFCKWLCQFIALKLKLPVKKSMEEYWIDGLGGQTGIINYFDEYLLRIIEKPLILAFDNLRCFYQHKSRDSYYRVADDIFAMLRGWHLSSKQPENGNWQKLRLILAYRPESANEDDDRTSPIFNLGNFLILKKFNTEEVLQLSEKYQLSCQEKDAEKIIDILQGNPYLIRATYEKIKNEKIDLELFFKSKFKNEEPFKIYLKGND